MAANERNRKPLLTYLHLAFCYRTLRQNKSSSHTQHFYLLSFYVNGTKVRPWKWVLMDIEKEEKKIDFFLSKFAYTNVLSYAACNEHYFRRQLTKNDKKDFWCT